MVINRFFVLALVASVKCNEITRTAWSFDCQDGKCVKVPFNTEYSSQSLSVCRLICGPEIGTLWPMPTGIIERGERVINIDHNRIRFEIAPNPISDTLWGKVKNRFRELIDAKVPDSGLAVSDGRSLVVTINLERSVQAIPKLNYDTDESYTLKVTHGQKMVFADITAKTFFGARHGLETLSQLIVYDDIGANVQILSDTEVRDSPAYKHRGVLLDTGRHYFSVKSIKRTLDGMAMSKLNTFHWHLVDSDSFPLELQSHPDLHRLGAFSPEKVYSRQDIREVVAYALVRGIRVIPDFDGPAHVGEGWQEKNVTVCFNAQPWKNFCNQPPCGQLDPTNDMVYNILEDIYREIFESFDPNIFHMGGDTVSVSCWKSSRTIRKWMLANGWDVTDSDYLKLWGHFQTKALEKVDNVSKYKKVPIILWAADPFIDEYLDNSRYIIQTVWKENELNTRKLLDRGFKMISSQYDLFINGGTAHWNGQGNIGGWQKLYEHRPDCVLGRQNDQILGSEAAVWSEQVDELTLDGLLWPKASALAERLWSNPKDSWQKAATRILIHRELLAENGIAAEALKPEWCVQNEQQCNPIY